MITPEEPDKVADGSTCSTKCTAVASARQYPSALMSNVLQRPSEASIPADVTASCIAGRIKLTEAERAADDAPSMTLVQAMFKATIALEHAVSTTTDGPTKPKVKLIRPA